jgi:hypothetical protein
MKLALVMFWHLLFILNFGTAAFADGIYHPLNPGAPGYKLYSAVAAEDQGLLDSGVISTFADFQFKGAGGRFVSFWTDGPASTLNVVLVLNEGLFLIPLQFANMDANLSFRRRWDDDPGIFMIVNGSRLDPKTGKLARISAQLKIAKTNGNSLSEVTETDIEF